MSPTRYSPVSSGSIRLPTVAASCSASSRTVDAAAAADVQRQAVGAVRARARARTRARRRCTATKSRRCSPSSKTRGGRSFSSRDAKIASTPVYGFESAWRGAVRVEEPQRDRRDAVRGAADEARALLVVLRQRVDRRERRGACAPASAPARGRAAPTRGARAARACAPAARPRRRRPSGTAPRRRRSCSTRRRACATGRLRERLEQHRRAERVRRRVLRDLVHRLADADARGEVDDRVDAVERPAHRVAVAHVADLRARRRRRGSSGRAAAARAPAASGCRARARGGRARAARRRDASR